MSQKKNSGEYGYKPQQNASEGYQPRSERGYQPKPDNGYRPEKSIPLSPPNQGTSVQPDPEKK